MIETNIICWILNGFNRNHSNQLDYVKTSVFALVFAIFLINLRFVWKAELPPELVTLDLGALTLFITGHVAPKLSKSGSELLGKEMDMNAEKQPGA